MMKQRWWIVVIFAASIELGIDQMIRSRVPRDADWKAAADLIIERKRAADGIAVAPAWADPIARLHLGPIVTLHEAALPDRSRQSRVWELSIRGAPSRIEGEVVEHKQFGRVTVRRIEREAARVLFDFTEARAGDSKVAEVGFRPVRCLPAAPNRTIEFDDVSVGTQLAISTGIDDFQSRYHSNEPVELRIEIDGKEIGALVHEGNAGWKRTIIDTTAHAGSKKLVRFVISAKKPRRRTFCFHAETHE